MTAGDITRTGREVRAGGAPDGGSFLVSATRWLLFHDHTAKRNLRAFAQPISCLVKSPRPFGLAGFLNHRDAWRAVPRRAGTRRAGVGAAVPQNLDWMSPPWSLGNLLADVMRRHGDTCAPVRAAPAQLRVANGVKRGRGREEVEAQERQKRCLSVPCYLEVVSSWGWEGAGGHRTTDF